MIKQLSCVFTLLAFSFLQSLAQTAPTALTANNITANTTTVSWVASTATLSTSVRAEGFEQPFGTQVWSNGGYDWFFDYNDDIREYNGGAHTGASSWYVRGSADRSTFFVIFR
ncbi:hypothetical protein [Pedobacter sp. SL55]|uniref:hypothetical protein n=1 Tax=Pedobacter sp. SL55 TaxID=2995161 RepID=UPI00226DC1CE|nr:hypothetical protein [Pedobacter sp. SL55]WAC41874.1 hypothetical protein OVA16_05805 [Pedobacter sp. SL55]